MAGFHEKIRGKITGETPLLLAGSIDRLMALPALSGASHETRSIFFGALLDIVADALRELANKSKHIYHRNPYGTATLKKTISDQERTIKNLRKQLHFYQEAYLESKGYDVA